MRRLPILLASAALAALLGYLPTAFGQNVFLWNLIVNAPSVVASLTSTDYLVVARSNGAMGRIAGTVLRGIIGGSPGVNVVTDYGADPTGVANNDTPFQNAINAACNNASPVFQANEVFIPDGIYAFSPIALLSITNACWIHGSHALIGGSQAGATLRIGTGIPTDFFQFRAVGELKITDLRIDISGGTQIGSASYCRVHAGGASYAANDTIVLAGGTSTLATTLRVTTVSAGAVTGCVIAVAGNYSVAPPADAVVTQTSTSGSGTGATFDMIYAASAAISVSGPTTTLTANAASGATVLTVASCLNFAAADPVAIEQDDGNYKSTTVTSCVGTTLTIGAGLSFAAASTHPVYDKYASYPLISDVVCVDFWDCIRFENVAYGTVRNFYAQDYKHDGFIKINGANPITGADRIQITGLDQNIGTSNACVEQIAGGDIGIGERSKCLGSRFAVFLNTFFTLTGTLLIEDASFEEQVTCSVKLHQSVSAKEYHNVIINGIEFSSLATQAQHVCVDTGTPNTMPKWLSGLNITGNVGNSSVSSAVCMINILDGDNVVIAGNVLWNLNTAGPNGICVGAAATHVLEYGNQITGYTTAAYGTMTAAAFDTIKFNGVAFAPAHTQSSVAAPTGTTSLTGLMMGLAGTITPVYSGKVHISVSGDIAQNTGADGGNVQLRTGTGTAPTNGAALTGTTRGSLQKYNNVSAVVVKVPFHVEWTVTGLTLNTAVWIDVGLAAVTGGTVSIADVDIVADEMP